MGTGDGELPYRAARAEPTRMFVGLDANADGMIATARKAARKPEKGGVDNLVLVQARIEVLPAALVGIADAVTIYFPWAGLLRAVLGGNDAGLAGIAALCRNGARVEAVFSIDPARDGALGLAAPSEAMLRGEVAQCWRAHGLVLATVERVTADEVRRMPTSWAKRLGFGAAREVWRLVARAP